jgi:hypothetical protein
VRKAEWSMQSARARPWAPPESPLAVSAATRLSGALTTGNAHERARTAATAAGAAIAAGEEIAPPAPGGKSPHPQAIFGATRVPPPPPRPTDMLDGACGHVDHAAYKSTVGELCRYDSRREGPIGGRMARQERAARGKAPRAPLLVDSKKAMHDHPDKWTRRLTTNPSATGDEARDKRMLQSSSYRYL